MAAAIKVLSFFLSFFLALAASENTDDIALPDSPHLVSYNTGKLIFQNSVSWQPITKTAAVTYIRNPLFLLFISSI